MKFYQGKLFIHFNGLPLRLSQNKAICGFCAGLAECFNMKVGVVRGLFVLTAMVFGFPMLLYFLAMFWLAESTDIEPQ